MSDTMIRDYLNLHKVAVGVWISNELKDHCVSVIARTKSADLILIPLRDQTRARMDGMLMSSRLHKHYFSVAFMVYSSHSKSVGTYHEMPPGNMYCC